VRRLGILILLAGGCVAPRSPEPAGPAHYIFFNRDRELITDSSFVNTSGIQGAQLKYTWRELERDSARYDFNEIEADLKTLQDQGRRLFVQLQDVTFNERLNVPDYIEAGGGAVRKYEYDDDGTATFDGMMAKRWDPWVQARFAALLSALGESFDGRIEGLSFPETAIGFERGPRPDGFTPARYRDAVISSMAAGKSAFPISTVLIYANFMPGESIPENDHGFLRSVYQAADSLGVAVGGPDFMPHRRGQRTHVLPLIRARGQDTKAGLAVQFGNLSDINPGLGRPNAAAELAVYGADSLGLDYIFWGLQEPFYSRDILPMIHEQASQF
jgi:hypothetical protein